MRRACNNGLGQTYVIGEMASAHDGSTENAIRMIDAIGRSNANAVQFQIWQWDTRVTPNHPDAPTMERIQLTAEDWSGLASYVRDNYPNLEICGCVGEPYALTVANTINVDCYKLHSSDLSNESFVKSVAETGKRIDLSVGGSTISEVETALNWIAQTSDSNVWLMYGLQLFPTDPAVARLAYLMNLGRLFQLPVGYQDHSAGGDDPGYWLPATAIGMGCDIIEKHITHDRAKKGVDHQAALNPDEFEKFMTMVRTIESAIGSPEPCPFNEAELKYRKYAKKSLVATRTLDAGTILSEADITVLLSPDPGLSPQDQSIVIGKATRVAIEAYSPLKLEHLQS